MTKPQANKHWNLWRDVCAAQGWDPKDNARRHTLYIEALDHDASFNDLDNAALDKIFPVMQRLAGTELVASQVQLDEFERGDKPGERRRLIWRIEQTLAEPLMKDFDMARLCEDLFGTSDWKIQPIPKLTNLRNTVVNRARERRAAEPVHANLESVNPF